MTDDRLTLAALHAAYARWLGQPTFVLERRRRATTGLAPTEINVLFFQPSASDQVPAAEDFCFIATAGLSTRAMPEPVPHAELIMRVDGHYRREELEPLGRRLAELAVVPFQIEVGLRPGILLGDVAFPLFEGMDIALLTHWGVWSPTWLPGLPSPVLMLSLQPIFESEARIIQRLGAEEACRRFLAEGVNWHDPTRPAARLDREVAEGEEPMPRSSDDNKDLRAAIDDLWADIEAWYAEHAPDLGKELAKGATARQISAFEKRLGTSLPPDFAASARRHNGGIYIGDYLLLPLNLAQKRWASLTKLADDGMFAETRARDTGQQAIQDAWWHRGWIPFAEDSGGNVVCVDTEPGARGVRGQILVWESAEGPSVSDYDSFRAWLQAYRDDLHRGVYALDREGFLERRR